MNDMSNIANKLKELEGSVTWLVTGAAGFIGSHLTEYLLSNNQNVIGLDNFSTGSKVNLELIKKSVTSTQWNNFEFYKGDICNFDLCQKVTKKCDLVLHQAALGSVNRSIADPIASHCSNVDGFLNMLYASKENKVERFIYASSSSVYGSNTNIPKIESDTGLPLSPYALTKSINEMYARMFSDVYFFNTIGLRYFNVFGERQNPDGPYAAVIPKWINQILNGKEVEIFGDGLTSRDFCYVQNAVYANILSALTENKNALNQVFNISANKETSLNELFEIISKILISKYPDLSLKSPKYSNFRAGDVRNSLADISKSKNLLEYEAKYEINQGLKLTVDWFDSNYSH